MVQTTVDHGAGTVAADHATPQRGPRRVGIAWWVFTAILGAGLLWPLLSLQGRAFSGGFSAFQRLAERPGIGAAVWNTVLLGVGSVVIAVTLGTGLAWCATKAPPRLKRVLAVLPIVPLVLPAIATVSGWIFLLEPRVGLINIALRELPGLRNSATGPIDLFTVPGIIVLTGFSLTSFVYLFVYGSLRQRGTGLEAAAAAAGASPMRVFFTVTLPLLRPAIVYSSAIVLLLGLGQFTAPLLIGGRKGINVITTEIFHISQTYPVDYAAGAALGTPLLLAGLVVVLAQRRLLRAEDRYTVVQGKSAYEAAKPSRLAGATIILYFVVAALLPIFALVSVSLTKYWTGSFDPSEMGLWNYREVLGDSRLMSALSTTLVTAFASLLVLLPLGFLVARAILQRSSASRSSRSVIDFVTNLPLTMPSALFGFAILYSYAGPPLNLYGTPGVFVVVFAVLLLPHAVRPQLAAMIGLGEQYVEAARVSGAGTLRSFVQIVLPLIRTGVATSAAIALVLAFHEFAAVAMVRASNTQVLSTLLYDYLIGGSFSQAGVVAVVMGVVTLVGVAVAVAAGGSRALENL